MMRANSLKSLIILFLALGFFWFYVMAHPWMAFIDSDSAVPFQLVLERWLPQDLFYWQTSRMGMLYEVVWKAVLSLLGIRESIVGSMMHPELFYLGHVLLVFAGFAFWLQTFESRLSKWLFALFFIPLTHEGFRFLATPGQPYGVVFTLNGMFFWTLLKHKESLSKQIFLGMLLGAMFVQHELAFLILAAVYFAHSVRGARDIIARPNLITGAILAIWMVIGFYFKARSREWDPGAHYRMTDVQTFLTLLQETWSQGRWAYDIQRPFGFFVTLAAVVYALNLIRSQRYQKFYHSAEQTTFIGAIVGYTLIHLTRWYIINGKDPRYFTNLIPLLIWVFLRKMESMQWISLRRPGLERLIYFAACVMPLATHQAPSEWLNPIERAHAQLPAEASNDFSTQSISLGACPGGMTHDACHLFSLQRMEHLTQAVQSDGCAGYIDDYWNSHILVVSSGGKIQTSAGTHIRNPILFARVRAARPLCVMVREPALQKYISDVNCKKSQFGYFVCN